MALLGVSYNELFYEKHWISKTIITKSNSRTRCWYILSQYNNRGTKNEFYYQNCISAYNDVLLGLQEWKHRAVSQVSYSIMF